MMIEIITETQDKREVCMMKRKASDKELDLLQTNLSLTVHLFVC
jgi:hypothetical protein